MLRTILPYLFILLGIILFIHGVLRALPGGPKVYGQTMHHLKTIILIATGLLASTFGILWAFNLVH